MKTYIITTDQHIVNIDIDDYYSVSLRVDGTIVSFTRNQINTILKLYGLGDDFRIIFETINIGEYNQTPIVYEKSIQYYSKKCKSFSYKARVYNMSVNNMKPYEETSEIKTISLPFIILDILHILL